MRNALRRSILPATLFIILTIFSSYADELNSDKDKGSTEQKMFIVDEVVTTARGRMTQRSDIPGSVEVVDETEIRELNPIGISDALSRRTGLSVSSDMPWGSRTVIRGLTRDQVVMLVDGARVVTATAIPAQFGTVATGDIERIEVLKGPLSVLYGSGSTGGVVNVITRKGGFTKDPRIGFMMNPSYESGANGVAGYERATVSTPRLYLNLSQSNRNYTDYRTSGNERVPNSQFQDRQTQFNFGVKVSDNHTLEGRYQYFTVIDAGIPGNSAFPPNALANYPTVTRTLADIGWTWRPESQWLTESKISAYYQPIERRAKLQPNAPASVLPHPVDATKSMRLTALTITPNADHNVYGARWQNVMNFGKHTVVGGLEGWQKNMVSDRTKRIRNEILDTATGSVIGSPTIMSIIDTPIPDSSQRPVGVFAEDTFALHERLKITLGGRIDRIHTENDKSYLTELPKNDTVVWDSYTDDDTAWSVVTGAVYELNDAVDINLTAARSFRSPTIEERYLYADLGGVLTVGDPEIDSEKGTFVEGGATARLGNVKLSGQAFINAITDMVIRMPGGEIKGRKADYQYTNAGEARLWGIEATADWLALPSLLISTDISILRGTDEKYDTDLPSMPPMKGHVSGRWSFGQDMWIEPLLTLVANQDKTAEGERETAGYGLVDIATGISVYKTGAVTHDLVFGIKNVTDKQYRDHLTVSRGFDMYGMGRSFYVSWRIGNE